MGCGKSSVGRRLSELLCCPFMDLDDVIVEREGRSIPEIFTTEGEPAFRQMELEALKEMVPKYSRGHLPLRGPLPLAGGGKMPLPYIRHTALRNLHCFQFFIEFGPFFHFIVELSFILQISTSQIHHIISRPRVHELCFNLYHLSFILHYLLLQE